MPIDWFTVAAQALNFLILVWLMKRFLYQPILHAIDEREKRIAAELEDAAAKKEEARKEREEFRKKNDEFEQHRSSRLAQVDEEGETTRQKLLADARQQAELLASQHRDALRNETENLSKALTHRTQLEVFAIARKTLADLASTSLETRMGELFTHRLRELDGSAKQDVANALATGPALIRTAFDLPPDQRAAIQQALNETFSAEVPLRFETAPNLISGIELSAGGQKVAWSIAGYLASLEEAVADLVQPQAAKPQ